MKTTKTQSAIPFGPDGFLIDIDCSANQGLPNFNIVGMPSKSIIESRERIRSAIVSSGFSFPRQKITANLAPADMPKASTGLDLPIALGVLTLSQQLLRSDLVHRLFCGELALDGQIRPIRGIISVIEAAIKNHLPQVFIPAKNANQAALLADQIEIIPVANLRQL